MTMIEEIRRRVENSGLKIIQEHCISDIQFLLSAIAQKDKEIAGLKDQLGMSSTCLSECVTQRDTARANLRKYGRHKDLCLHGLFGTHLSCTCGFAAALD